jgi:hypothetical protein
LAHKVNLDMTERMERMELWGHVGRKEFKAFKVPLGCKESPVQPVQWDHPAGFNM